MSAVVGTNFGPYRIADVLGTGASATVYLARNSDDELIALKLLSTFAMADASFREAIEREWVAVSRLDHPGVIRFRRTGTIAGTLYIEMDRVEGPTLAELLRPGTCLAGSDVLRIGADVARALHHGHGRGVVHRDVKPSNVLLAGGTEPILFDYGLALDLEHDPAPQPGRIYGTPLTTSPEQARADLDVDHRADVYGLGVTLYRMAVPSAPFYGERRDLLDQHIDATPAPPSTHGPLAGPLEDLILQCLAKDRNDRPQTADEIADRLDAMTPMDDLRGPARRRLFRRG